MAQIIAGGGSFNPASLQVDDLYIQIQNPPGFIVGVPTDVVGMVGTASWGPVNQPQLLGNPFQALQTFGPISAAALTDPYDMATDLAIAFGQATSQAVLEAWGVRVTDGTDVAASGTVAGAASSTSQTATIANPTAADLYTLTFTSTAITGSPVSIAYTVPASPSPTPTNVATAMVALINANAALLAAGIFASSAAGVISVYQPTALSPQMVLTKANTGTGTVTLGTGAAVTTGITVPAIWTGTQGNGITITLAAGAAATSTTVTVSQAALGLAEVYPNIPNAGFFAAFKAALVNGINGVRGPSSILNGAGAVVNGAVASPTAGNYTLANGTDGRAGVVTATLLGSNSAVPATGLYALQNVSPAVGIAWIVGSTDASLVSSLVSFGRANGVSTLLPFPTGTSTATAVTAVGSQGQHDPSFAYLKDWIYFYDPVNNVTRLVSPNAFVGGMVATLSPEQGWGNKPVQLVNGTERNNPLLGNNVPYSVAELGQLEAAGIILITNPIPAGSQFGTRHGQGTSLNPVTQGMEYWRLTTFLARSLAGFMGIFVDQVQSQQPNDPLRNQVKNTLNTFFNSLVGANGTAGVIDSFTVVCSFNNANNAVPGNGVNTPASIASHFLFVLVRATYLSTVRFFILSLQGGTTVVSVGSGPGQQLQSN